MIQQQKCSITHSLPAHARNQLGIPMIPLNHEHTTPANPMQTPRETSLPPPQKSPGWIANFLSGGHSFLRLASTVAETSGSIQSVLPRPVSRAREDPKLCKDRILRADGCPTRDYALCNLANIANLLADNDPERNVKQCSKYDTIQTNDAKSSTVQFMALANARSSNIKHANDWVQLDLYPQ